MGNLKFKFKILALAFLIFNSLGCATYKFHHGQVPYDKGYIVSRDDYDILEYTLGPDNSVPDRKLAKERWQRRRHIVEDYYKKMSLIENHFKMAVWDPCANFLKLIGGIFRLPFIALADYRYEHNPVYREKINKLEKLKEQQEEARVNALKEKLNNYIQADLAKEGRTVKSRQPATQPQIELQVKEIPAQQAEPPKKQVESPTEQAEPPKETPKPAAAPEKEEVMPAPVTPAVAPQPEDAALLKEKAIQETLQKQEGISAVIVSRPQKGYSPLKVNFYGNKSRALKGRIVSYEWDFGDGDTSAKENPVNTYYSNTSEPKYFNVTLTVKDNRGNSAQAAAVIEVLNR